MVVCVCMHQEDCLRIERGNTRLLAAKTATDTDRMQDIRRHKPNMHQVTKLLLQQQYIVDYTFKSSQVNHISATNSNDKLLVISPCSSNEIDERSMTALLGNNDVRCKVTKIDCYWLYDPQWAHHENCDYIGEFQHVTGCEECSLNSSSVRSIIHMHQQHAQSDWALVWMEWSRRSQLLYKSPIWLFVSLIWSCN